VSAKAGTTPSACRGDGRAPDRVHFASLARSGRHRGPVRGTRRAGSPASAEGPHSGYTRIADLTVNGTSQGAVTPGPNTVVAVPQCGAGGAVTLNEQIPIVGGAGLQVTAIAIYCPLLGIDQRITVARVWFG
jgi:hypothetical protein